MRIAYLGPAGTFTEDALREAAAGRRLRAAADARPSTTRSSPSSAARPSGRWFPSRTRSRARCGAPSTRSPSRPSAVTIVGEHDFAVRAHLIAREPIELERDRGGPLPSPAARPVRPLPARAAARGRTAQRQQHRRGGADGQRVRAAAGRRSAPAPRPSSTAARSCARGSRTRPTTSPASSGSRPPGPSRRAAASGRPRWSSPSSARTTPARWSTRCASSPAASVNLTRIESRPLRQGLGRYMFFCDLEGGDRRRGRRRGDRRRSAPRPNRCGSSAPTPSTERGASRSAPGAVRRIPGQHGTSPGTQRDV